jgi:hypothetical protein
MTADTIWDDDDSICALIDARARTAGLHLHGT